MRDTIVLLLLAGCEGFTPVDMPEIARIDLDGKIRKSLASDQHYVSGLTLDEEAVYWILEGTEAANYLDGALWRAPKPK